MAPSQLQCCYEARLNLLLYKTSSLPKLPRLPSLILFPCFQPRNRWLGLSMCAHEVFVREEIQEKKGIHGSDRLSLSRDHTVGGNGYVAVDDDEDGENDDEGANSTSGINKQGWNNDAITSAREVYGEVSKIIASRAIDHRMFYLIEWKDGHEPSWLPSSSIAKDVIAEYESNWWKAVRAGDDAKLSELLSDEGRDVDAVDENGRTALLFATGIGSDKCVRNLVEAGADVDGQDPDGLAPLHMATGYARQTVVSALLEFGADPELADAKGRTPITLAQEIVDKIPRANPLQFARRAALENILKLLDSGVYETMEVEQVLDKRSAANGAIEYLVKWKDGAPEEWVPVESVADDLIHDYEAGLEYGVAEEILEKRGSDGQGNVEYLVRWADVAEPTWEPFENVAAELVANYEKMSVAQVEKLQLEQSESGAVA